MGVWDEICWLASDQHGAFSTVQAAEVGADSGWLRRNERDRRIGRLRRGAWAVLGMLDEWTPMAGIQLVVPRAVAGARAGAWLHAFDGVVSMAMDVLVPPNVGIRGATTHRCTDLVVPEIVVVNGLRCTDEVRTLIDYAAVVDDEVLERAMESVFRRAPEKRALLVERAEALARPGKSGPRRSLRVEARLPEVRTDSDLETVYWQALRRHGVELPVRQHPVGRYRLDLAYPDIKLFVELDGYGAHSSREAFIRDRHRQNDVVAKDWSPLRFTDSDVRYYARRTAMQTQHELRRRRARLVGVAGA